MIRIKLDHIKTYFSAEIVKRAKNPAMVRALRRFGAFVRRTAKKSIRAATKASPVSKPGEPPRSHGKRLLSKNIFFVVEPEAENVLIGPALLNQKASQVTPEGSTIPEVLEKGGVVTVQMSKKAKKRQARMVARPYMGPAMDKELPRWRELWADSIVGGR